MLLKLKVSPHLVLWNEIMQTAFLFAVLQAVHKGLVEVVNGGPVPWCLHHHDTRGLCGCVCPHLQWGPFPLGTKFCWQQIFPTWLLFFKEKDSFIPCMKFGSPYLGMATAAARARLPIPTNVCSIFLWPSKWYDCLCLMLLYNVYTNVDARDCSWGLHELHKRVWECLGMSWAVAKCADQATNWRLIYKWWKTKIAQLSVLSVLAQRNMGMRPRREDVPLVEFIYLALSRIPGENYCRWLRSS